MKIVSPDRKVDAITLKLDRATGRFDVNYQFGKISL
jgi:hypothetical protein